MASNIKIFEKKDDWLTERPLEISLQTSTVNTAEIWVYYEHLWTSILNVNTDNVLIISLLIFIEIYIVVVKTRVETHEDYNVIKISTYSDWQSFIGIDTLCHYRIIQTIGLLKSYRSLFINFFKCYLWEGVKQNNWVITTLYTLLSNANTY